MAINLPPGYTLDSSADTAHVAVPEGYKLDEPTKISPATNFAFERGPNYPTAAMTDTTPNDLLMLQGATGIARAGLGATAGAIGDTAGTAAKYAGRFGEDQALKALGAKMGQVGSAGIPESRAIGREMVERGIIKPLRGPIGLEETVGNLSKQAGEDIGAARGLADARTQAAGETAPDAQALTDQAKKEFGPSYQSGHLSGRAGTFNKALDSIANPVIEDGKMTGQTPGTFTGNAAKATELNAAGTPDKALSQAENSPYSDIANMISEKNTAGIKATMSPEEAGNYDSSLHDYSMFKKVKQFMESGEKREMAGRGGASLLKTVADKSMDMFGNRAAAVGGIKTEGALNAVSEGANAIKNAVSPSMGLIDTIKNSPQTLGKFAMPLSQAYRDGGNQGVAAMHYVLSTTNPEYNQTTQEQSQ